MAISSGAQRYMAVWSSGSSPRRWLVVVVHGVALPIQQCNAPPLASIELLVGRLAQGLCHTTLPPM